VAGVEHRLTPGTGDLMMALSDALIAAQNAAIAAESLGIGSCYIGDIFEQAETHVALFDLPQHAMPAAMLCFGRAAATRAPVPRYEDNVVHENRYQRMSKAELGAFSAGLLAQGSAALPPDVSNIGQLIYRRKYASDFMAEMNRSVDWWLERWQTAEA
jgi:FMN reductase (NADPH)/FMN reductase [NAD(P)H]